MVSSYGLNHKSRVLISPIQLSAPLDGRVVNPVNDKHPYLAFMSNVKEVVLINRILALIFSSLRLCFDVLAKPAIPF